jgi:gas vesicle protein GvpL/GvpF
VTTYLYGLVLARNAHLVPAHITGIGGSGVRVLDCGALGAIVSSLERAPQRALEDVRAHDHALQSVVHHGATAAAGRFGQTFPGDVDARSHVIEHGDRIVRVLGDCDGCVEMRLLLGGTPDRESAPPPVAEDVGPGRAYLEQVKAERDTLGRLALRDALGPLIRAERVEQLPNARGIAFSHLIERTTEREYRSAIAAIPSLSTAAIVGPLALYSFAEPR